MMITPWVFLCGLVVFLAAVVVVKMRVRGNAIDQTAAPQFPFGKMGKRKRLNRDQTAMCQPPPSLDNISVHWIESILSANDLINPSESIASFESSQLSGGCHYSVALLKIHYQRDNDNVSLNSTENSSLSVESRATSARPEDLSSAASSPSSSASIYIPDDSPSPSSYAFTSYSPPSPSLYSLTSIFENEGDVKPMEQLLGASANNEIDIEACVAIEPKQQLEENVQDTEEKVPLVVSKSRNNRNGNGYIRSPANIVVKTLCWDKSLQEKLMLYTSVLSGQRKKAKNLTEDVQHLTSYEIEYFFYSTVAHKVRGIALPEVWYNYADKFNCKFGMVLEDLNGLEDGQPFGFGLKDSFDCLMRMASFHAGFWFSPEIDSMYVWDIAGHWTGELKEIEKRNVLGAWANVLKSFDGVLMKGANNVQKGLGQRMHNNLDKIFKEFKSFPNRTLLHGDFKVTNLFIDNKRTKKHAKVYAIDWQWAGKGTGALDVAYFVCTSVDVTSLTAHNIKHLVKKAYHLTLLKKVTKYSIERENPVVCDYHFSLFWYEFMICVIDFVIYCICDKWCRMTMADVEKFAARRHDGLHLRSIVHMQKLIDLAESFMNKLGMF